MTAAPPDRPSPRSDHPASRRTAARPALVLVIAIVVIVALILLL